MLIASTRISSELLVQRCGDYRCVADSGPRSRRCPGARSARKCAPLITAICSVGAGSPKLGSPHYRCKVNWCTPLLKWDGSTAKVHHATPHRTVVNNPHARCACSDSDARLLGRGEAVSSNPTHVRTHPIAFHASNGVLLLPLGLGDLCTRCQSKPGASSADATTSWWQEASVIADVSTLPPTASGSWLQACTNPPPLLASESPLHVPVINPRSRRSYFATVYAACQ